MGKSSMQVSVDLAQEEYNIYWNEIKDKDITNDQKAQDRLIYLTDRLHFAQEQLHRFPSIPRNYEYDEKCLNF